MLQHFIIDTNNKLIKSMHISQGKEERKTSKVKVIFSCTQQRYPSIVTSFIYYLSESSWVSSQIGITDKKTHTPAVSMECLSYWVFAISNVSAIFIYLKGILITTFGKFLHSDASYSQEIFVDKKYLFFSQEFS